MNFVAAILYAVSTSSLVALLLAFVRGGLNSAGAAVALSCGLLVLSLTLWQGRNTSPQKRPPSLAEWLAIIAFALVSLRIFLWVVIVNGDDLQVLSPNNLGDLSLHLTYVRYLGSGVPFWPDNPIFTGGKLTYPIGVDLFHSLLTLVGLDVLRGFIWMGLVGATLTGIALWRWGRGFVLFGFLANGGLAGFQLFTTLNLADFQTELAWKSFALALFATQRGLLFALPAGLLLLSSWRTRFFGGEKDDWRLPFWGELLLYASLPLFHFHTFLFLSVLLGVWFLFYTPARWQLAALVGSAFLPATLLVFLITGGLKGPSIIGWKTGWMWDDSSFLDWCHNHLGNGSRLMAAATFWPVNFGILPVLVVMLAVALCRRDPSAPPQSLPIATKVAGATLLLCGILFPIASVAWGYSKIVLWIGGSVPILCCVLIVTLCGLKSSSPREAFARLCVLPALAIFIFCCFVKFAPWEWDNTKLMIWSYLAILPFLWSELLVRWPDWARQFIVFMLFFSGFVSTLGGIDASFTGFTIAQRSELDGVAHAVRTIPVTERFAGAPTYNHPLLLDGRKMVLGYLGHVSSHGLAWEQPAADLDALMNGEENWRELADKLGARYLFWGRYEDDRYKESPQPWRKTTRMMASGEWGAIFDLHSPAEPLPAMQE